MFEVATESGDEWFPNPREIPSSGWNQPGAILDSCQQKYFDVELYTEPWKRATAITVKIVRRHVLVNGNKRLALSTLPSFVWLNAPVYYPGMDQSAVRRKLLHLDGAELEHLLLEIACVPGEMSDDQVVATFWRGVRDVFVGRRSRRRRSQRATKVRR